MKKYRPLYIFLILFFVLSSCTPAPAPTLLPIETVFAATHGAIMSQTAAAKPLETDTPQPTETRAPTLTPVPSATNVVLVPTITPTPTAIPSPTNITSGSGNVLYACELVQLNPGDTYVVKPNESFHWVWRVRNIGTKKWFPDTMFLKYARGAEYYIKKKAPLGDPTDVGEVGIFRIKMQAPKEPGTYTTTFSLNKGIHYFCYFKLKIIVKK